MRVIGLFQVLHGFRTSEDERERERERENTNGQNLPEVKSLFGGHAHVT